MKSRALILAVVCMLHCGCRRSQTGVVEFKPFNEEDVKSLSTEIGIPRLFFLPGLCELSELRYEVSHEFDGDLVIVAYEIALFLCRNPESNLSMLPRLDSTDLDEKVIDCRVDFVYQELVKRGIDTSRISVDRRWIRYPVIPDTSLLHLSAEEQEQARQINSSISFAAVWRK
jgi:hypothetical protein